MTTDNPATGNNAATQTQTPTPATAPAPQKSSKELFRIFLGLGCTSFGGPVAHLGYFHNEFVDKRRWLSEQAYADLVALCQFLPGPASSQVGMGIGMQMGGMKGALAAWCGFTLPSVIILICVALGVASSGTLNPNILSAVKIVAVAVVLHAVWSMAQKLCQERWQQTLMVACTALALLTPGLTGQLFVIALAAIVGTRLAKNSANQFIQNLTQDSKPSPTATHSKGRNYLLLLGGGLLLLPIANSLFQSELLAVWNAFFRTGSMVFGGGHVVLPLLESETVATGWVTADNFLMGYGAAQAVPGPLFTLSSYLGSVMPTIFGEGFIMTVFGGLFCTVAIFAPSLLLLAGVLPYWNNLRTQPRIRAALMGINAGVVGLLLAACYNPVWISGINDSIHFAAAAIALLALRVYSISPWKLLLIAVFIGWML